MKRKFAGNGMLKAGLGTANAGGYSMPPTSFVPSPRSFSLLAPAKINLWLRVLGRREDGFHELETRLAPLELCDRLTLTADPALPRGEIAFSCDEVSVPVDGSNLVVKAVRALEPVTGKLPGMRLHLEKRIPHGAGLGGGSSDAAAALRLVREVFCQDLREGVLQAAAAEVGSDVPFFLLGNVADATGRGEKVVAVPEFTATPRVLLVKLPFGIPTPWAYRQWKDALEVPGLPYRPQATACGELRNDLERPVFEKFQVLGHLKAMLLAMPGVSAALMSGSGSTVFALLGDSVDLAAVKAAVHEEVGHEVQIIVTRLRTGAHPIVEPADFSSLPATDVAL